MTITRVPVLSWELAANVFAGKCGYCERRTGANWVYKLTHRDSSVTWACEKCFKKKPKG